MAAVLSSGAAVRAPPRPLRQMYRYSKKPREGDSCVWDDASAYMTSARDTHTHTHEQTIVSRCGRTHSQTWYCLALNPEYE